MQGVPRDEGMEAETVRRMSFHLTKDAILERRKTVTRRLGWLDLKVGERLLAVDKLRVRNAQKLAVVEIVSIRREPLSAIMSLPFADQLKETEAEGFGVDSIPGATFVSFFCEEMKLKDPHTMVTRIEFRYVDAGEDVPVEIEGGSFIFETDDGGEVKLTVEELAGLAREGRLVKRLDGTTVVRVSIS